MYGEWEDEFSDAAACCCNSPEPPEDGPQRR